MKLFYGISNHIKSDPNSFFLSLNVNIVKKLFFIWKIVQEKTSGGVVLWH